MCRERAFAVWVKSCLCAWKKTLEERKRWHYSSIESCRFCNIVRQNDDNFAGRRRGIASSMLCQHQSISLNHTSPDSAVQMKTRTTCFASSSQRGLIFFPLRKKLWTRLSILSTIAPESVLAGVLLLKFSSPNVLHLLDFLPWPEGPERFHPQIH